MTRKELSEVLKGITNQLDSHDRNELLHNIINNLTTKQKNDILDYCQKKYSEESRISLEENGIIEEEEDNQ